jgi:photosystem II stability/assembly factor-like uncharacterized protein
MTRSRAAAGLLLIFLIVGGIPSSQNGEHQSCRHRDDVVLYQIEPDEVRVSDDRVFSRADAAELVRVDAVGQGVRLSIVSLWRAQTGESARDVIWTSLDGGKTWRLDGSEIPSNLGVVGTPLMQAPSDDQVLYRVLPEAGLYLRSDDGGDNWRLPDHKIESIAKDSDQSAAGPTQFTRRWFELVAIHPRQPLTLFATVTDLPWAPSVQSPPRDLRRRLPGLFVSVDGGQTWNLFSEFLKLPVHLGINPIRTNEMYAYSEAERVIARTEDGGATWRQLRLDNLPGIPTRLRNRAIPAEYARKLSFGVKQFVFQEQRPETLYLVTTHGVYRTRDGAESWCLLQLGFDVWDSVYSMALSPLDSQTLFVATKYGLLLSRDDGRSFSRVFPRS